MSQNPICEHCGEALIRVTVGNVVDYSHNPNKTGSTSCPMLPGNPA